MSMQVYQRQQRPSLMDVTMPVAKFIHLMGEYLIADDRDDLFKTVYYNDQYHYYHGEKHPDHPGFLHHWMIGGVCVMTGQALGAMNMMREMIHAPQIDVDDIPLPGGKRIAPIPIPYQEVKALPAPSPSPSQYQKLKRQLDSIAKL